MGVTKIAREQHHGGIVLHHLLPLQHLPPAFLLNWRSLLPVGASARALLIRGGRAPKRVMAGRTRHRIHPIMEVLLLLVLLLSSARLQQLGCDASSSAATASSSSTSPLPRSTLPRSTSTRGNQKRRMFPPWNLSPQIDHHGFLKKWYARIPGDWEPEIRLRTSHTVEKLARIRQVPGDGNCLFHSISFCLRHAVNGTHWSIDDLDELYRFSHELRLRAVQHLNSSRRLFLQGRESLRARELVQAAAQQYQLTADEYCECMLQDSVWAGGPELVSLCNLLQRPIHVYELAVASAPPTEGDDDCFVLRRMACFGSPKFDNRYPLHILSADSRFPDVQPGHQLSAGNHFLAVFPQRDPPSAKKRKLRGGGGGSGNGISSGAEELDDEFSVELEDRVDDDGTGIAASLTGRLSHWIQSWFLWWKRSL